MTSPVDLPVYDYRIEKVRCTVSVTMLAGDTVCGAMFVQPASYGHRGPERPIEVLNGAEPFLPLQDDGGGIVLVAKERIVEVCGDVSVEEDELRAASARVVRLEMQLANGFVRSGFIMVEMPTERPRLLDFLNGNRERFAMLYTDDGVRLVNLQLIERVRPLD